MPSIPTHRHDGSASHNLRENTGASSAVNHTDIENLLDDDHLQPSNADLDSLNGRRRASSINFIRGIGAESSVPPDLEVDVNTDVHNTTVTNNEKISGSTPVAPKADSSNVDTPDNVKKAFSTISSGLLVLVLIGAILINLLFLPLVFLVMKLQDLYIHIYGDGRPHVDTEEIAKCMKDFAEKKRQKTVLVDDEEISPLYLSPHA